MPDFHFFAATPSAALSPFVETIWGIRGTAQYHVESVLPNGAIELMVNFGPRQRIVAYGEREVDETYVNAWISGIQDQRLIHASPSGADHIAVRFRPGGAHAFFDLPVSELTNRVVDLDVLVGSAVQDLRDQLQEARDDRARCAVLDRWLCERPLAVHPHFATVRRAMDLLSAGPFRTHVAEVCQRLGLSNRHLVAQFRGIVGLPPKRMVRIERLQTVIDACRGRRRVDWSRLAHRCGFADQSHLIQEFRRLGQVSPTEFLERRTPDESYVVIE